MTKRTPGAETQPKHPETLSVLERRGSLAVAEQRRLEMALAASEALRCSHQLGHDFDLMPTNCDEDAELIERLVIRAHERYANPDHKRAALVARGALRWLGIAALLIASAAAGATLWPLLPTARDASPPSPSEPERAQRRTPALLGPRDASRPPAPTVVEATPAPTNSAASIPTWSQGEASRNPPRIPASRVESTSAATSTSGAVLESSHATMVNAERSMAEAPTRLESPSSASTMFGAANRARQRGEFELARRLYAQLAASYPNANETALSYVLLARLALQQGDAPAALAHFEHYLALAPRGALAEESLEGKAQAYRRMGMVAEEAAVWRELLRRYPNSVYAAAARKRLDDP